MLLYINILLSGFILLFNRICWKLEIIRLDGAELELIRNMLRLRDIKTKSQTSFRFDKAFGRK